MTLSGDFTVRADGMSWIPELCAPISRTDGTRALLLRICACHKLELQTSARIARRGWAPAGNTASTGKAHCVITGGRCSCTSTAYPVLLQYVACDVMRMLHKSIGTATVAYLVDRRHSQKRKVTRIPTEVGSWGGFC